MTVRSAANPNPELIKAYLKNLLRSLQEKDKTAPKKSLT